MRRLDELGTAFGIAFGSFGELSPGLEKPLAEAAKKGGPRVCSDFLVPEGKPAGYTAKQRLTHPAVGLDGMARACSHHRG